MTVEQIKDSIGNDVQSGVGDLIAAAVCEWANCQEASADETGNIWIEGPQAGHWLGDNKIVAFWAWFQAQNPTD